eukprot:m.66755 g.66755  ORF g.66755 m.66755 type:complete len:213 (-) comp8383_c1_seq1:46-684(-)
MTSPPSTSHGPSKTSWERMWSNGITPGLFFDAGQCEPALIELLASNDPPLPDGLALVPGCGRGYAVEALANPGTRFAVGLELSPTGAHVAREYLGSNTWTAIVTADFFTMNVKPGTFDLIYDCTFLCALHPGQRQLWAQRMHELLRPGGELVTDIFPIGTHTSGPPYAMSVDLVRGLLEPLGFTNTLLQKPSRLARPKTSSGEMIARWVKGL